ncbi:hypothetical protein MED121_04373 [Marinomonas sp. MED121]|nr:hypothetical protein MED121_04373 [Marinomonas sp. MED121]
MKSLWPFNHLFCSSYHHFVLSSLMSELAYFFCNEKPLLTLQILSK